ncbi:unnamed protein product [Amaranthus hypochondriacus]
MTRKCTSSIPSSFASIYMISAFFAISFFSLLYLKYPQQIDYSKVITPTKTPTIPSYNVIKNVDKTIKQTREGKDYDLVEQISPSIDDSFVQLTPPNVEFADRTRKTNVVEEVQGEDPYKIKASPPVLDNTNEKRTENGTNTNYLVPITKQGQQNESENEDQDQDQDETIVSEFDHMLNLPSNFSKEERIEWFKQKLPESRILESTPRTRKFEVKMQEFVRMNRCRVNIFMTWISTTTLLGKREMFSLESILKAHPNGCVIIISRIMASKPGKDLIKPLIERGYMILTVAPDFALIFSGTPAQDWLERLMNGRLDPGKIPITQNLSNLLRLAVLYKYGGVYFDSDMIILKDVSKLRNSIGVQEVDEESKTWVSVNNAVLIFDKNHPLLYRFIEEFNSTFDGNLWGFNGPYMASKIVRRYLDDPMYQFNVMSPMAFYPIDWESLDKYFKDPHGKDLDLAKDMFVKVSKESYGVHLWNRFSKNMRIEKGSVIGKLISSHCIICQDVYGL